MDHKNIHEALHAIYNNVGYVQKQKGENLNYTFAGEGAFIRELRPAMIKHGVTISVSQMDSLVQEHYITGKYDTKMVRSTIHVAVKFTHVSGDSITVEAYGEGSDAGDKSLNKAMTDAYKYALRQTFMIETGDDPDKEAEDTAPKKSVVDSAKELGAKEIAQKISSDLKDAVGGMTIEMAKTAKSSTTGKTYGELSKEELIQHFNGLSQKKKKLDEWNEEDQFKFDAAKTLIQNFGKS